MQFIIYLSCVWLAGVVGAYELSPFLRELYCVLSGRYSNRQEASNHTSSPSLMSELDRNFYIPALSAIPVMYIELMDGEIMVLAQIGIFTEDKDGLIRMQPHNFTNISNVRPGTITETFLRSLTKKNLQEDTGCEVAFVRIKALVFEVIWPECRHVTKDGKHRSFKGVTTCDFFTASMPAGAAETVTFEPYVFQRTGIRFPLENAPEDYVCRCNNTSG